MLPKDKIDSIPSTVVVECVINCPFRCGPPRPSGDPLRPSFGTLGPFFNPPYLPLDHKDLKGVGGLEKGSRGPKMGRRGSPLGLGEPHLEGQ